MVKQLAANLEHFASIVARDVGVSIADVPSTGAAGGISGGLYGAAGAELVSGVETIIAACGYAERLAHGDVALLITGEGQLDDQTGGGKAPLGIANLANKHHIPVIALAGAVTAPPDKLREWGFVAAFSILPKVAPLDEALQHGQTWMGDAAQRLGNVLALQLR
jgi:glycerate kinase